jgi:hypothetical protein
MLKKIKRFDPVSGAEVIVEVASDYVLQNGEQFLEDNGSQPQAEPAITREQVNQMLNQARTEERNKLQGQLQRVKEERTTLQTQIDELNAKLGELTKVDTAKMKPDEKVQHQLEALTSQVTALTSQLAQERVDSAARIRATELVAYRELAMRPFGDQIFPELVNGSSEEEIDSSAQRAHQQYLTMEERLVKKYKAPTTPAGNGNQPATPVVVTPSQNPAFVTPPQGGNEAGLPTPVATAQVFEGGNDFNISDVTSEEAVRSGKWGGELRQKVLANLRATQPGAVPLGTQPRFMANQPQPVAAQPMGVTQPQGQPHTPASPPGQVSPPPQGGQGQGGAVAAAQTAIQRTRTGANPVVSQLDPQQQRVISQTAQGVRSQQGDAAATFATRFAPSPPASADAQGT